MEKKLSVNISPYDKLNCMTQGEPQMAIHDLIDRLRFSAGLAMLFGLILLFGCDSSDTRSAAKSATSGTYEVLVRITAPVNGSTLVTNPQSDVTFSASTSGGTAPITLTWQVKGPTTQNTATGDSPTITTLELGVHTVTVTATDSKGITGTDSITINITASGTSGGDGGGFLVDITSPVNGATVVFVDGTSNVTYSAATSGGTGTITLTWQVKGPSTENTFTGDSPTITFLETGVHTITVTARDGSGLTATDSISITVSNLVVDITAPVNGATITFVDSAANVTFSASTSGGTGTITYTWQTEGPATENTASGATPTITFLEEGVHTVTVTAKDTNGVTATDSITITIATGASV